MSRALAVMVRNARFRAWKAYGIPVEGGWVMRGSGYGSGSQLTLTCGVCGVRCERFSYTSAQEGLVYAEWSALLAPSRGIHLARCEHLQRLLDRGPDPPEVIALTELEMLSTG